MSSEALAEVASVLPPYLEACIPFAVFNSMQSECLEAWSSNANMLVSAPTGSGKTVCFELAILREVNKVLSSSDLKRLGAVGLGGKFVFIAPTKALCTEKAEDWRNRFGKLGLQVEIITGDVQSTKCMSRLLNADLILTTAEKWDSITRNLGTQGATDIISQISLLLLDEVHQLGDSRGSTFEAVVTRMLLVSDNARQSVKPVGSLRVVAVSATVRNATDVAKWLRVAPEHVKDFDHTFRPVPLDYNVLGYYIRNRWQSNKVFDDKIRCVLRDFSDGKPTLVFCPSRRQSGLSANALVDRLCRSTTNLSDSVNDLTKHLSSKQRRELSSRAAQSKDRGLAHLLQNGVGVHNAEMSPASRHLVEFLFRQSLILCLFSTSTLAQGVNLPARLVVILGTTVYRDGALHEYDVNMLMQMCGRAGRPGLDTRGVAVIMTSKASTKRYENLKTSPPEVVESQLESRLEESLNAEIARQFITDIPTAAVFLMNSFFCVRERERLKMEHNARPDAVKSKVTATAMAAVNKLSKLNLIRFDEDGFDVSSTAGGTHMAKYCVSFETMEHLAQSVPKASSPALILRVLAETPDISAEVILRRSEKRVLNEINELIRLPIRGKVKDKSDKLVILLQIVMGSHLDARVVDFALRSEALRIMESVSRICACLLSLVLDHSIQAPYEALVAVLQVCRGLLNRCYWDGPTPLQQIPGISHAAAKALSRNMLGTFEILAKAEASRIDEAISSKTQLGKTANASLSGKRIQSNLREFPKFHLQVAMESSAQTQQQSSIIEVRVAISAQVGHWKSKQQKKSNGFILVGSHAVGLIACTPFILKNGDQKFSYCIPHAKFAQHRSWVDVTVGSDMYLGVDVSERLNLQSINGEARVSAAEATSLQPRGTLGAGRRITIRNSRHSKRLKQTKFSSLTPSHPKTPVSIATPQRDQTSWQHTVPPRKEPGEQQKHSPAMCQEAPGPPTCQKETGTGGKTEGRVDVAGAGTTKPDNGCGDESETEVSFEHELRGHARVSFAVQTAESKAETAPPPQAQTSTVREYDNVFRNLF